jgi:ketosteroid isomerase-like protein
MAQDNLELMQRAIDSFNRRDLSAYLALMDPDVEAAPLTAVLEGEYRGHDGIRRWWDALLDVLPDYTVEAVQMRDLGDVMLADLHARAHGPDSDSQVDQRSWFVAKWRNARIVWWANYQTEAEALADARLLRENVTRVR